VGETRQEEVRHTTLPVNSRLARSASGSARREIGDRTQSRQAGRRSLKHIWRTVSRDDLITQRLQGDQEGKDVTAVQNEFDRLLILNLDDTERESARRGSIA